MEIKKRKSHPIKDATCVLPPLFYLLTKFVKLFLAIIAYKSAQFLAIKLLSVNFSSLT